MMKIKIGKEIYSLTSKEARLKGIIMLVLATVFIVVLAIVPSEIQQMILYMSGALFLAKGALYISDHITNWYIKKRKTPSTDIFNTWMDTNN